MKADHDKTQCCPTEETWALHINMEKKRTKETTKTLLASINI